MKFSSLISILVVVFLVQCGLAADNTPPDGFKALFNGKDLSGWKGLVANPAQRAKMTPSDLAEKQKMADERMRAHWSAQDGVLVFDGKGDNLCTEKDYGDFEMFVDWKIQKAGDSGIYVRGTPQIQIWDPDAEPQNAIGSGGLFNNQKNPSKPSKRADKPIGEWNTFRIRMVGEKVSVWLNGELVVDNVTLENYWERAKPIYSTGQIELQNHGNPLYFKNIYIKELK
jgi:3-keto-disaccharide hydrolase